MPKWGKLHYYLIDMDRQYNLLIKLLATALLAIASQVVLAEDIVSAVNKGEPNPISENGGFFEIGISAISGQSAFVHDRRDTNKSAFSGLSLAISGGYRYKRAFIEAGRANIDGLNLGFSLWQNQQWSVDFLAANIAGRVTSDSDEDPPAVTEAEKNAEILDRDTLIIAAGVRATRYFDNNRIAQFRLASDYYENNGMQASLRFGQKWQLGNWSWTGLIGAKYTSRRINNYLVGITADEATVRFPEYVAKGSVALEFELDVRYPLTRKLVFASRFAYKAHPEEITDSPLVDEDSNFSFSSGITYVF